LGSRPHSTTDLTGLPQSLIPQIKELVPGVLAASAGLGLTVVQIVLSIPVAEVLLANASGCGTVMRSLTNRLFGDRGPEIEDLARSTIWSVMNGILGVAVIQTVQISARPLVATGETGMASVGGDSLYTPAIALFCRTRTTTRRFSASPSTDLALPTCSLSPIAPGANILVSGTRPC
jgi:hypothetical protein